FAWRTFVLFIAHIQSANDEKLSSRGHDLVQDFSRRGRRCLEREINNVALDQGSSAGSRARLGWFCGLLPASWTPLPRGSRSGLWNRSTRSCAFFRQRRAAQRGHAVHPRVEQDIGDHLYLGKLLSE